MIKKALLKYILPILMVFFIQNSVFAEKHEWIDKNYDFSRITRVLLLDPSISDKLKNGITEKEIIEIFNSNMKFPNNIKVMTLSSLVNTIKMDTGIDLIKLNNENQQEAMKLLDQLIPMYADITIVSRVFDYSVGSEYREGYTYTTTEYQTAYVHSGYGGPTVATIETPVQRTHTVPGRNVKVAYSSVRWDVYDANSKKAIWSRFDDRARANNTIFDNTKPKDLLERIIRSFCNDLSDKLKNNK